MTTAEFEHVIRAAAGVLGVREVLVIGSQALHATMPDAVPREAQRSVEVDVAALSDEDGRRADLIDGAVGEGSLFHSTFGYYAHGVTPATATLPAGWRTRLIRFETPATNGVVAWCLDTADLWISKAIAGRDKDLEFCRALRRLGAVDEDTLRARLAMVETLDPRVRERVASRIHAAAPKSR